MFDDRWKRSVAYRLIQKCLRVSTSRSENLYGKREFVDVRNLVWWVRVACILRLHPRSGPTSSSISWRLCDMGSAADQAAGRFWPRPVHSKKYGDTHLIV